MLQRPRIQTLIHKGLQHPLLVVLAAPGYGKTQAMAAYVGTCDASVLWLSLSHIDNIAHRFWGRLMAAIAIEYPPLSSRLEALAFPDSAYGFDAFAKIMEHDICSGQRILWVIDDFDAIDNPDIQNFIRMLAEANFENFHIALLSNALDKPASIAFLTTKRAVLLASDLRFNKNEIRELYRLHSIPLKADELDALERYTEGWPMPLNMLVMQHEQMPDPTMQHMRMTPRLVSQLFNDRFFSVYAPPLRALLVKLSLVDSFTKAFALGVFEGNPTDLALLDHHAFITNEPHAEHYCFHHLYRNFLSHQAQLLTREAEQRFWCKAAVHYEAGGNLLEAIRCYRKGGDRIRMLNTVVIAAVIEPTTDKTALFLLEHLDLLTPEELSKNLGAEAVRAFIYMMTYQLDAAEALAIDLEKRLVQINTPESSTVLGELLITHALVRMMRGEADFAFYFEKAAGYLPDGSVFARPGMLKVNNNHSFFMPENTPGAKERIEKIIHDGVPWMARVFKSSMGGMPQLFSAEIAYLTNRLDDAKQLAYRAVYKARLEAHHDLACNAYCLLARTAYIRGDLQEVEQHIRCIEAYAEQQGTGVIKEIRDTALSWFYIKMRDFKRIPNTVLLQDVADRSSTTYRRSMIVYINYLVVTGEYAQAAGLMEAMKDMPPFMTITQDRLVLYLLLALCYLYLNNLDAAMGALWTAYDMCYQNGLITIFIEMDKYMLLLIAAAREQTKYHFAPEWLDLIEKEATAFSKRADAARAAYQKRSSIKPARGHPLSKRELTVLQAVARGLTREEIALEQYISLNTVKSAVKSIYGKLGANNMADAVSIAIAMGCLDGYAQNA